MKYVWQHTNYPVQHWKETNKPVSLVCDDVEDFPVDLVYPWRVFGLMDGNWLPFNMLQRRRNNNSTGFARSDSKNRQTQRDWRRQTRCKQELNALANPAVEGVHATAFRTGIWIKCMKPLTNKDGQHDSTTSHHIKSPGYQHCRHCHSEPEPLRLIKRRHASFINDDSAHFFWGTQLKNHQVCCGS